LDSLLDVLTVQKHELDDQLVHVLGTTTIASFLKFTSQIKAICRYFLLSSWLKQC